MTTAWAQPQAVTWSTSYENTDEHTVITVHAEIEEGWHLYSQNLDEGGPIPPPLYSKMILPSLLLEVGRKESHMWSLIQISIWIWPISAMPRISPSSSCRLRKNLLLKESSNSVCNDEMCLPPTYEDFSVRVTNAPVPSIWKGLGTTFWLGFLGGFAALIMPCIFPMIPLTVSFFTKQSKTKAEGILKPHCTDFSSSQFT